MNEHDIIITVDALSRALKYEGSLILGVRGDNCANKVYFDCPKAVSDFITDVSDDSVTAWVDFKNAFGEIFKMECAKLVKDTTSVYLTWTITNDVTYKSGDVSFNLCIQKVDDEGILHNAWHTTNNLIGKVLPSVDASKKTPIVITHDSATLQHYALEYANLASQLADTEAYIDSKVDEKTGDFYTQSEINNNFYNKEETDTLMRKQYMYGSNALVKHSSGYWYTPELYNYDEFTLTFRITDLYNNGMLYMYLYTDANNPYTGLINLTQFTGGTTDSYATVVIKSTKLGNDVFMLECTIYNTTDMMILESMYTKPDYFVGYIVDVNSTVGYKLSFAGGGNKLAIQSPYLVAK